MPPFPFSAIALITAAASATTDAIRGRIPNVITLPAMAMGLALHAVSGSASLMRAVLGLFVAVSVPWVLHRTTRGRAIGGGDVKLFAALGALLGPVSGLEVELSSFLLLGAFAMLRLAFDGHLGRVVVNAGRLLANPFVPERLRRVIEPEALTEMRLGPAIFAAMVTVTVADQLGRWTPWLG